MMTDTDIERDGRRDRLIKERIHDPYRLRGQLSEPSVCSDCGVLFADGRWQWQPGPPPAGAQTVVCPACRRVHDKVPAGFLTLSGRFLKEHRDEILRLIRNKAEAETAKRPMKRLMQLNDEPDGSLVVTFTDAHMPRGVGGALSSAYQGDLTVKFTDEAGIVRATWTR